MEIIINKYTLELQKKITEIANQKNRKEICDIIKNNKEWQDRYIQAFQPTEKELEYIKSNIK
jgi:hypothetical protein